MNLFKKDLNWLIFITAFIVFFSFGLYVLKFLPVNYNFSCSIGGNFTPLHLTLLATFCLVFSTNLIYLKEVSFKKSSKKGSLGLSGVSLILMTLSTVCTICLLPAISLLGLSISLSVFSIYNLYFQFLAITLGTISIYFLHKTYKNQCLFNQCEL